MDPFPIKKNHIVFITKNNEILGKLRVSRIDKNTANAKIDSMLYEFEEGMKFGIFK